MMKVSIEVEGLVTHVTTDEALKEYAKCGGLKTRPVWVKVENNDVLWVPYGTIELRLDFGLNQPYPQNNQKIQVSGVVAKIDPHLATDGRDVFLENDKAEVSFELADFVWSVIENK